MADISKICIDDVVYDVKDAEAREALEKIFGDIDEIDGEEGE